MARRRIVVCADDAGWDESNDEAIFKLADAGSISAISVLVQGPNASACAQFDVRERCSLGLHFSLTWSPTRGSHGLSALIAKSLSRRISSSWVVGQLEDQLCIFEKLYSRPPDFVDGHQHVQILAGVREPMIQTLAARYCPADRPAIRLPLEKHATNLKGRSLALLGAKQLERELAMRNWPRNTNFAGTYNFTHRMDFRLRMKQWLSSISDGGLVMVHPGATTVSEHGEARAEEFQYLSSKAWRTDLTDEGISLICFRRAEITSI